MPCTEPFWVTLSVITRTLSFGLIPMSVGGIERETTNGSRERQLA